MRVIRSEVQGSSDDENAMLPAQPLLEALESPEGSQATSRLQMKREEHSNAVDKLLQEERNAEGGIFAKHENFSYNIIIFMHK